MRPAVTQRRILLLAVAALALTAGAPSAAERPGQRESMTVRSWPPPESAADYPELHDPELAYLLDRPSFGIAFSGGGTRSASATWGQLRGLERLGWLERARYLSAVSGGAWTAIPYTFLPEDVCGPGPDPDGWPDCEEWFLGPYLEPHEITVESLNLQADAFVHALAKTQLVRLYLSRLLLMYRGDETYSRALGKRFLDDIRRYECRGAGAKCGTEPKHRYFVAHRAQRDRLIEGSRYWRRGEVAGRLGEEDFIVMRRGRPFLVVGATLLARKRFASEERGGFLPVEMTPLYSGIPRPLRARGQEFGGFYESPAYDGSVYRLREAGEEGVEVERPVLWRPGVKHRRRFTLSDVMGSTGAAPVQTLSRFGWNPIGFPELSVGPVGESTAEAREYLHGDGGHIDNLGLIPLLARRVEKILLFVNATGPFLDRADEISGSAADVRKVFLGGEKDREWLTSSQDGVDLDHQPLLAGGEERLTRLADAFRELDREGLPLVYCGGFTTLENPRYGIRPYEPRICWIYLEGSDRWLEGLPESDHKLLRRLRRGRGPFWSKLDGFPHYATFLHRWWKLRVIDLGEEQVNASAHLTAWTTVQASGAVGRCLDLPVPEGVRRGVHPEIARSSDCPGPP